MSIKSKNFSKVSNMRIGYLCTTNLERTIKAHDQKVLNKNTKNDCPCKCAGSCKYPLKGSNCRTENIVYRATVNSDFETRFYIGLCSTQVRFRYANHKKSFKDGVYENDPELSKYICSLKRRDIDHEISWEVIKRAQSISDNNNSVCMLCLKEATAVVYALNEKGSLNKRNEFIFYCRHIKKSIFEDNKF